MWRNGRLVAFAEATTHVLSHMAARGSQIFDVLLVSDTADGPCAVGLRPHVTRFLRSAEMMGMTDVGEVAELERAVTDTVLANVGPEPGGGAYTVKLIAAWDDVAYGLLPDQLRPNVYVSALPYVGGVAVDRIGSPVRLQTASMPKIPPSILPPSMKVAASYTPGVREVMAAEAAGFDQVVFRTESGDLAESTTLSLIVIAAGGLAVPPLDSVLDGITRRIVLDAAQHLGLPVEVRPVAWAEVLEADELLLTSTARPVAPVSVVDDTPFDAPGPLTAQLADVVGDIIQGRHQLSDRWLTPLRPPTG